MVDGGPQKAKSVQNRDMSDTEQIMRKQDDITLSVVYLDNNGEIHDSKEKADLANRKIAEDSMIPLSTTEQRVQNRRKY